METGDAHQKSGVSEKCRICEAAATGLHYGVITCEGCKVFFKRYMDRATKYRCYFGGNCIVNLQSRSRCKTCRFRKCIDQGMSVEAIRLGRAPRYSRPEVMASVPSRVFEASCVVKIALPPVDPRRAAVCRVIVRPHTSSCPISDGHLATNFPPVLTHQSAAYRCTRQIYHDLQGLELSSTPVETCENSNPLNRNSTSISSFNDENLTLMLDNYLGQFIRPCVLPDAVLPGSYCDEAVCTNVTTSFTKEPSLLRKYWGLMRARNHVLECSIRTMIEATETVFSDQIRLNQEYLRKWHGEGLVPHQPQCTLEQMLTCVQESVSDFADRLNRFALFLPGFMDLSQKDRTALVRDRWYTSWLIMRSSCYRDGESFHPIGRHHFHYCRYWMRQILDENCVAFIFSVTEEINALHLTLTETFLLMVISFFRIDSDEQFDNKTYIDFLFTHYLDALIQLVGLGRGDLFAKLQQVIKRFSVVNEVYRRFVQGAHLEPASFAGVAYVADQRMLDTEESPACF